VVLADLDCGGRDYGKHLAGGEWEDALWAGFCLGAGASRLRLRAPTGRICPAAFVFYGPGPADVTTITAPV